MSEASPTRPTGRLLPTLSNSASRSSAPMFCQWFDGSADACCNYPSLLRALAGDSGCEHDRTLRANMRASVFHGGQCSPIAQLKRMSGLLEIRSCEVVQMQAIAGGEYQMIERAKL